MELPKNITQIGETNPHCKVYVEDYVISYIKQLNQFASDKELAVALYGIRKEEAGITYLFMYGACRITFLQKECRHLSQAVQQEVEKQRRKFFADHIFLGYRILNGEMVEGFHVCEQNVCRYVEGYAQFYEKNDAMLAFMLEERQEASAPEVVDQEKYNVVKKRQEERRSQAAEKGGHAFGSRPAADPVRRRAPAVSGGKLKNMKIAAAAVFGLLCVTGLAAMENGEKLGDWQLAVRELMEDVSRKQLPDVVEVSNGSAQVGTIVAEDKLTDAILNENASADSVPGTSGETGQGSAQGAAPGSSDGSGQGTVPGSGDGSAQGAVPGSSDGSGQGTVPGSGDGSAQGTAPGSSDGTGQEAAPGSSDGSAQEAAPGSSDGSAQGAAPGSSGGSGQDSVPGSGDGSGQGTVPGSGDGSGQGTVPGTGEDNNQETGGTSSAEPAAGPAAELESYIVKRGDTLIGICIRRYGSDARVSEICSLNNIGDPDDIKEGEKIFLPQ